MEDIKIFIDKSNFGGKNNKNAKYRWSYVYAHGKFEMDFDYDIVLFNQPEPINEINDYYLALAENNKTVIIKLVVDGLRLRGRCCYIDDYEALTYVNSPNEWS